ncbi:hypothetical protein IJG72_05160 [bacterium]|nr:hypothetical protein [bacterium]
MDLIKKLTGKNKNDYEQAAAHIIDCADVCTFEELVKKDDFLFDFIKQNVANRLENACNRNNVKNLFKFLKFYSPSYEDFIAKALVKFADDEILNVMKNLIYNGSVDEQCYAAKFYSLCKDESVTEKLRGFAFCDNEALALNSTLALSHIQDKVSLDIALEKINSNDDFEILSGVKFISAYGAKSFIPKIFEVMKKTSMSEHIACEIGYMENFVELLTTDYENTILAILNILQGLGEIVPLSNIFAFQFFEIFEKLINSIPDSKNSILLLTAQNKFNQLTENDEYLFDEDKNTKDEVNEIKLLLNNSLDYDLINFIYPEINENSDFVYFALDLATNLQSIRKLLTSKNQTLVLKALETLKNLNSLTNADKEIALQNVADENIKLIIDAL